ncbi:SLOG family protein [Priestia megaterium]
MSKPLVRIALTGHRPDKLGGYDYLNPINLTIAVRIRDYLLSYLNQGYEVMAISGMALGADQIFAKVALKLKKQGYSVKLEAAIPCDKQYSRWTPESKQVWQDIVDAADKVTYVSREPYKAYLMQKRNEYMVDACDTLIAIYNGTEGGTYNCLKDAIKKQKHIIYINPEALVVDVKGDLLASNCDVIFHQANCMNTMNKGIAKQIRITYPAAYQADSDSPLTPKEKFGTHTYASVQSLAGKSMEVVNLYGQYKYGRSEQQTDYDALRTALFSYLQDLQTRRGTIRHLKFGLPKNMGCRLAGGNWSLVKQILQDAADHFTIRIYTYELYI